MHYLQNWPMAVLLAALLPIIIHMLNRLRYRTVHWAAMIFLLKANKAATRRAKLRQYLLLLFRALVILFLVWAMMRPVVGGWLGATAGGAPEVVIVLLDRSASMEGRGGAEDSANRRAHAVELLAQAAKNSAGSRFVLIENVLRQPVEIADVGTLTTMQMAQATDTAADVPAMLRSALEYLVKNKPGSAEIWLASDLQTSNWRPESPEWGDITARFAGLPQETHLRILDLSAKGGANLSIAMRAAEFRPSKTTPEQGALALTTEIKTSGGTGTFPLRILRDGAASQFDLVVSAPTQRQAFKFDIQKIAPDGGWGKLELPADESPADNAAYFVYRPPTPLHATVISSDPAGRSMAAAAAPDRTRGDRVVEVISPAESNRLKWKELALVIWHGAAPGEATATQLRAFVESGGVVLAFPPGGESGTGPLGVTWSTAENSKEPMRIATWDELDGPLAKTDNGASLPLARLEVNRRQVPRFGSETVHVHGLFSDGQPFLVEQRLGNGRVYAVATVPTPEWSTLGEGFVLLPMVQRMLMQGGVRLAPPALATAGEWQPVEGEFWTPVDAEERRDPRWRAGIYKNAGRLIALNRPDQEDDVETVAADALPNLLKGVKLTVMTGALDLKADRLQSEIWPAMIIATMVFMCLEMLLATSRGIAPVKLKPKVPVGAAPRSPKREEQPAGGRARE
jgi:hypothetical protein